MGVNTAVDEFGRPSFRDTVGGPGQKTGPRELARALGAPSHVVTPRNGNPYPNSDPNDDGNG